jgi:hypothetical protein
MTGGAMNKNNTAPHATFWIAIMMEFLMTRTEKNS